MPVDINAFLASIKDISAESFASEDDRIRAKNALGALFERIRNPWEIAVDEIYVQVSLD